MRPYPTLTFLLIPIHTASPFLYQTPPRHCPSRPVPPILIPNPLPILTVSPSSSSSLYQSLRRHLSSTKHHGVTALPTPPILLPTHTASLPTPPHPYQSFSLTFPLPIPTSALSSAGSGRCCLLDDHFTVKLFRISTTNRTAFFRVPTNSFTIKASSNKQHRPDPATYY
jgi:hypothetical protein